MAERLIRIATRRSGLAMAQSGLVARAIEAAWPSVRVELEPMATRGDRRRGRLAALGGKGLFTRELEEALRTGRVELAVHSAKDLPAGLSGEFAIVAVPARQDARDALVGPLGALEELPAGAAIGTGSMRRRAQLLAMRGDLRVVPVRGNVETRLRKALEGKEMQAVVLAMAGLERSGLARQHAAEIHPLPITRCIPAAGQGTLAVEALGSNAAAAELLAPLDDADSRAALDGERRILRELRAGCQSCVAIHLARRGGLWHGWAMAARPDGSGMLRLQRRAPAAGEAAEALLEALRGAGAAELLAGR